VGTTQSSERTIAAVERAAEVLSLFADGEHGRLGVTEISKELNLSKAVVHRILTSFRTKGFIELDEESRRYSLGPAALALGYAYLDQIDIRALVHPTLELLSAESRETATLSIRTDWTRVYLEQVTPKREVRMTVEIGKPFPLHAGSSGKAFLAFLDPEEQEKYLTQADLSALTPQTVTDPDALRTSLEEIRRRGYAVSFGERQRGAVSVAAPIRNRAGRPEAVVSICGPAERMSEKLELAAGVLVDAVTDLSRRLGYRVPSAT
jgi:DNA-binding IclR family transcriptional regulator